MSTGRVAGRARAGKKRTPSPARRLASDPFRLAATRETIRRSLAEDVGRGDVTTETTIAPDRRGTAEFVAREEMVVAGLPLIAMIYAELAPADAVRVVSRVADGDVVAAGRTLAKVQGPMAPILTGERLALNFLQQLSGVASLTARFVAAVEGTGCRIVDTRKTVPGLRTLQKYAVRVGGGQNHRFGLDDGILIKDNHIAACGSVRAAVEAARAGAPHGLKVEVECDELAQVKEAVAAGADTVLLDNMSPDQVRRAAAFVDGRALIEVSGGVSLDTAAGLAAAGPDLMSVGALTHSATAVDIGLDIKPAARRTAR